MAETTYDRTKPQKRFTAAVSRGLRESAVLAIGVIALVMLIALVVVPPRRSGVLLDRRSDQAVAQPHRALRRLAVDLLFFLFGRPAYLFPIMLGVACFVMFRQRDDEEGRTRYQHRGSHRRLHAHAVRELRTRHTALVRG